MRKEVKLGFAIGGVLLSVLIVYALVMSGGEKPEPVSLVTSSDKKDAAAPADKAGAPTDIKPVEQARKDTDAKPGPTTDPLAGDPFKTSITPQSSIAAEAQTKKSSSDERWAGGVLQTGMLPVMLSTTPEPTLKVVPVVGSVPAEANRPTPGPGNPSRNTPAVASNLPESVGASAAGQNSGPTTGPNSGPQSAATSKSRTHTVQSGETFSSIAAAAYGNAAYYAHLMRANPNVDPKKLRPGMVIVLPPDNEVRADAAFTSAGSGSASTSAKIDSRTQYVVQPGDNLFKIASKLYGRSDRADQLYDLNRATIGDDPAKLKVGQVLKLPEAPLAKAQ